tara:strand:+ start:44 stop:214 length:171 start_codon:yes stop_codon:yes gene_type:complete
VLVALLYLVLLIQTLELMEVIRYSLLSHLLAVVQVKVGLKVMELRVTLVVLVAVRH